MDILLAEDDTFLAKIYTSLLKEEGYEVTRVKNGKEALEAMQEEKPKVLLLDMLMPKKDGFAVLEEMQGDSALKKIPVIVLSSLEQESDIKKAMSLGAKDYFTKSAMDTSDLAKKVKKYLK